MGTVFPENNPRGRLAISSAIGYHLLALFSANEGYLYVISHWSEGAL